MQYRNDHICRGPKGREGCGRFRCPSLVHPLPSPLGVRAPGKMSGGHFPVRTGRLGPWEVDRRRRDERGPRSFPTQKAACRKEPLNEPGWPRCGQPAKFLVQQASRQKSAFPVSPNGGMLFKRSPSTEK